MNSLEIIKNIIVKLEDDLQHYTMVDIDKVKAKYIELEIEVHKIIKRDLERLEKLKKALESLEPILDIYTDDDKGYIDCLVENPIITFDLHKDKEFKEYELLKEVLEYE